MNTNPFGKTFGTSGTGFQSASTLGTTTGGGIGSGNTSSTAFLGTKTSTGPFGGISTQSGLQNTPQFDYIDISCGHS